MSALPDVVNDKYGTSRCLKLIVDAVRSNDTIVEDALVKSITYYPEDWQRALVEDLKDLTDPSNPRTILYMPPSWDEIPFLTAHSKEEEEDLPF